jgi:hypothetical protein
MSENRAPAWFRRHRWGLIALVVLVPAAVLASLSIRWFDYHESTTQNPQVIAEGETGVVERTSFTLTDFTVVGWDSDTGRELGLLEGTEAVSAIIHVDASESPASDENLIGCDALLVADGPDGDRVWEAGSNAIDYYPGGDLVGNCSLTDHEVFDWEAVFVTPEGIADQARLIVTGSWPYRYELQLDR